MPEDYSQRFDFHSALEADPAEPAVEPEPDAESEAKPDDRALIREAASDVAEKVGGRVRKTVDDIDSNNIKNRYVSIPASLIDLVRATISCSNNSDAVAAYLYVTTGRAAIVPEHIQKLSDGYRDDGGMAGLQNEIVRLEQQMKAMAKHEHQMTQLISDLELALVWLLGEKMGFSVNVTASPDKMDFLFPEADALLKRLREQSLLREKEAKLVEGREIYKAKYERGGKK